MSNISSQRRAIEEKLIMLGLLPAQIQNISNLNVKQDEIKHWEDKINYVQNKIDRIKNNTPDKLLERIENNIFRLFSEGKNEQSKEMQELVMQRNLILKDDVLIRKKQKTKIEKLEAEREPFLLRPY